MGVKERKNKVLMAFLNCLTKYKQIILVDLLNISTRQIVKIRQRLHKNKGLFLVGKNTITRLAIKILTEDLPADDQNKDLQKKFAKRPELKNLIPHIKKKVAFVFSDQPYIELKEPIEKEVIAAPAKAGIVAPAEVWVKAGPTSIGPDKFGDFQRLGIQTKTAKSTLEIQKDHKICSKGEIVSETIAAMCRMLNIVPFEYGMKIQNVFLNGEFIPKDVIDLPADSITSALSLAVKDLTAICLEAGIVNEATIPQMLNNSFKDILAISLEAGYKLPQLAALSEAKAAPAAPAAKEEKKEEKGKDAKGGKGAKEEKKEEKKEEVKEDENMDLGDMFG